MRRDRLGSTSYSGDRGGRVGEPRQWPGGTRARPGGRRSSRADRFGQQHGAKLTSHHAPTYQRLLGSDEQTGIRQFQAARRGRGPPFYLFLHARWFGHNHAGEPSLTLPPSSGIRSSAALNAWSTSSEGGIRICLELAERPRTVKLTVGQMARRRVPKINRSTSSPQTNRAQAVAFGNRPGQS
jgi:hypothetical protein